MIRRTAMTAMGTKWNARGSEWNRWDPHIHAPGTVLNDEFKGDWESYLQKIENATPPVRALGVTDYCSISTYRELRKHKQAGRLPKVDFIFPNVEMRLDMKSGKDKGINIHLLFCPDANDHEEQIERVLRHLSCDLDDQLYHCSREELIALGRKHNPKQTDDFGAFSEGVNQFKVAFKDLKDLFRRDAWTRDNCVVAVVAGEGDGTAGMQHDSSFAQLRQDMERFAHVIFSANPGTRDFWLGKKSLSPEEVERKYRCLKCCLHGSDAHRIERVAAPDGSRYCWIKGDLAFESLRQAIVEPEERVWVGEHPPITNDDSVTISQITPIATPWLKNDVIHLNPGLVSVIGARGSGKTALIDFIAAGAHALVEPLGESSFLRRATEEEDLIGPDAQVREEWADGEKILAPFRPPAEIFDENRPLVCYLSQHFVNRLCSSAGLAKELVEEIERVIFEQTDQTERFETNSFRALADYVLGPILRQRRLQTEAIISFSEQIANEERLTEQLPKLLKERGDLFEQINKAQKEIKAVLTKGQEARAKRLLDLEEAVSHVEAQIEALARRQQSLKGLLAEVNFIVGHVEPERLQQMREQFSEAALSETDWQAFGMEFKGEVVNILAAGKKATDKQVALLLKGDQNSPPDLSKTSLKDWPLEALRTERNKVKAEVGIDVARQKRYQALQSSVVANQGKLRISVAKIKNAEGAEQRRKDLILNRRAAYKAVFDTFVEETDTLKSLYEPLRKQIVGAEGALGKLSFVVRREVKWDDWVQAGEDLIDLRKFRATPDLKKEYDKLLNAWRVQSPEEVAETLQQFNSTIWKHILAAMLPSIQPDERADWIRRVGNWLFSTEHVSIRYALVYDGVEIERLSPGTRGIVLLLLYLAIDKTDRRPLLIDQPEENLDPKSVFDDLVPHFREARRRRQIIIVTHNANLVVNTDADQVIVASSQPAHAGSLPDIAYQMGSLENPVIRTRVCEILEGGERAFLERERRYRLEWDKMLEEEPQTSTS